MVKQQYNFFKYKFCNATSKNVLDTERNYELHLLYVFLNC